MSQDGIVDGGEVARNALREMQRPDLAELVCSDRSYNGTFPVPYCSSLSLTWLGASPWGNHKARELSAEEDRLISKAFILGHRAMGHDCDPGEIGGIACHTCRELHAERVSAERMSIFEATEGKP